jgi:signal transduction histidine kinase/DNA-binding response OmpR family regulator
MAKILIVDDHPTNRQFLVTLLAYAGYELLEAGDGAEALALLRAERPQLVITDILMPTMDGYEFARQVRADPEIAHAQIIFYTATYLEAQARELAHACGVSYLLVKPTEPQEILDVVSAALQQAAPPAALEPSGEAFDREHLRLLTSKLAQKVDELEVVNQRLTALFELGQQLATERDTSRLLQGYCSAARRVLGARYAFVALLDEKREQFTQTFSSGLNSGTAARLPPYPAGESILDALLQTGQPLRLDRGNDGLALQKLPPEHPPMHTFLAVPMTSTNRLYGALYLGDKVGLDSFSEEDEQVALTLAAQLAIAYENARWRDEIQDHATQLQQEIVERKQAEAALRRSQQETKQLNAELEQRVTERTAQLEMANKEMESFAYSVSHDLRAPLRAIFGFSEMLVTEYRDQLDEEGGRYVDRIQAASQRMAQLIDDLLNLSRVSRGELRYSRVDLSALARQVISELRQRDPQREVDVSVSGSCMAEGDAHLLQLVLENLLGNAWKFTGKSSQARLEFGCTTSASGEQIYFVRDNGVGFSMKYSSKLFGAFQRLHTDHEFPGTGIGLATVQRIIHRHSGRIWAEAAVGQGATFYFTLPGSGSA